MRLGDALKLSAATLRANKVRTFLTSLGIIIGIGSVVLIMSVGAGAQSLIISQISSIGSNLIGVLPGASEENGPPASVVGAVITTLKYEDAVAIRSQVTDVTAVSAYNSGLATASYQNSNKDVSYFGVMADYVNVEEAELQEGRFFSEEEERSSPRVVVIGYNVRQDLFQGQEAVGRKIKLNRETFEVVGVMKARGVVGFRNLDDMAFMPISTAQKIMLGINYVNFIRIKVGNQESLDQAKEEVRLLLRDRHNISGSGSDDFTVEDTKAAADILTQVTDALKFFLVAIAGISLVVGGMGVMNIMLASINERIREIGLRKAVGAKSGSILSQFLLESMSIAVIGGLIGIAIGSGLSYVVAVVARFLGYDWDFIITGSSVAIGVMVALLIGLVFGIYPARRAAKLDPIEALRYE